MIPLAAQQAHQVGQTSAFLPPASHPSLLTGNAACLPARVELSWHLQPGSPPILPGAGLAGSPNSWARLECAVCGWEKTKRTGERKATRCPSPGEHPGISAPPLELGESLHPFTMAILS